MQRQLRSCWWLFPAALLASCSGGSKGSASQMNLVEVSNGFGLMLPYQVHKADAQGQ
ncbi:MAG: hypothetical protein IT454_20840, partial [Planctomycetes bacterium]|nr:hypothetical protein [Planctomycetota bacterium]